MFDPVINEANESSSACHPDRRLPVETRTPPVSVDVVVIRAAESRVKPWFSLFSA